MASNTILATPASASTYNEDNNIKPASTELPKDAFDNPINPRKWATNGRMFYAAPDNCDTLPPGIYMCDAAQGIGPLLTPMNVKTDNILHLPDSAVEKVVEEFQHFWKIKEEFTKRGFLHKRGFLLWGPPGSGKTTAIQLMGQEIIKTYNGVVAYATHPTITQECMKLLRAIEASRPVIVVLEDIDSMVHNFGAAGFLSLLDGEAQVDNIVFVATSNYPERLDGRFVDRPSRFDTLKFVGMPSFEARKVYLKAKENTLEGEELDEWARKSKGFSIAHLRELIIAVKCFGKSLDDVVERLRQMSAVKPTSDDNPDEMKFPMGIGIFRPEDGE